MQDDQPNWHPLLAAVEREPGMWVMVSQAGREYGTVRILRRGGEVGYRADDEHGDLLGYYRNLRAACAAVYELDMKQFARPRWPNNDQEIALARIAAETAKTPPRLPEK